VNNLASGRVREFAVVPLVALLGFLLLLAVSAYFPFGWDPPRTVRNEVTRSADGSLRFGNMNAARTPGTPSWLQEVRSSGTLQIRLVADPGPAESQSASIMMLASDFWHTDFAIGQDHSDLEVWLRRPGSDANGDPAFVIGGVFRPQRWTSVQVTLRGTAFRIDVDGTTRLTGRLPADSTRTWGAAEIALGDEVHGGGPWQGEIRHAEVRTAGDAVDYVRPGALAIPERYFYLPDHVAPFPPPSGTEWLILLLHLLSFIPVGFLIAWARRPPVRLVPAALLAAGLAVVLAAGKFLLHDRHMAVADIVLQTAGALLGALLAARLARHQPGVANKTELSEQRTP
jgi:hypothetical protein